MTAASLPNLRKLKLHALAHPCPEAGGRSRTVQPTARLDRWQILRDLLVDVWSNPDLPTDQILERHLSALSLLEADLIRRMFLNIQRILPLPADAVVDVTGRTVSFDHPEAGITTSVYLTFTLEHGEGTTEHIRLKTGRRPTSVEEAAVVWSGAEDGEIYTDLMAWPGEVESIEAPSDVEERLQHLIQTAPILNRSGVRPGRQCVWCARSAVCGAYPADRVVPTNARTVNLTKTDVEGIRHCHRRVAWRRVHGIPRDDGDDLEVVDRVSRGRLFHGLLQMAHGKEVDDPDRAARHYVEGVPPSEVADLLSMWDQHRRLLADESLAVRASEFPVGITLLEGDNAHLRGVTLIGFVDLTARDVVGAPVAVEVKTGAPGDVEVENDLYAVGMRRWIPDGQPIVIHRHYVGTSHPGCDIVEVGAEAVEEAANRLRARVAAIDEWDWDDPLQPGFTVGQWCGTCEYRTTCESYR